MYESHFGFRRPPFGAVPDARSCFTSPALRGTIDEIVLRLEAGQGICLLTGGAGLGKSLVCRVLATELSGRFQIVHIPTPGMLDVRSLFQLVIAELGTSCDTNELQPLRMAACAALRERVRADRPCLLLVDEAHSLSSRVFEELRTLVVLDEQTEPIVRLFLTGQTLLEEQLTETAFDAFNQQIACHKLLEPLSLTESVEYVLHRVFWAGGNPETVFSISALDQIVHASAGIPRLLNRLCDQSLMITCAQGLTEVDQPQVELALDELRHLPLRWNESISAPAVGESKSDSTHWIQASSEPTEFEFEASSDSSAAVDQHTGDALEPLNFDSTFDRTDDSLAVDSLTVDPHQKDPVESENLEYGADDHTDHGEESEIAVNEQPGRAAALHALAELNRLFGASKHDELQDVDTLDVFAKTRSSGTSSTVSTKGTNVDDRVMSALAGNHPEADVVITQGDFLPADNASLGSSHDSRRPSDLGGNDWLAKHWSRQWNYQSSIPTTPPEPPSWGTVHSTAAVPMSVIPQLPPAGFVSTPAQPEDPGWQQRRANRGLKWTQEHAAETTEYDVVEPTPTEQAADEADDFDVVEPVPRELVREGNAGPGLPVEWNTASGILESDNSGADSSHVSGPLGEPLATVQSIIHGPHETPAPAATRTRGIGNLFTALRKKLGR